MGIIIRQSFLDNFGDAPPEWVQHEQGRLATEAAHWRRTLPTSMLYELLQTEATHEGPISFARLDRVYVNQPLVDQLDRRVYSVALP